MYFTKPTSLKYSGGFGIILAIVFLFVGGVTTINSESPDITEPVCHGADFNADSRVDATDLAKLVFYWGLASPDYPCVDMNRDGKVGLVDFGIFVFQWTPSQ